MSCHRGAAAAALLLLQACGSNGARLAHPPAAQLLFHPPADCTALRSHTGSCASHSDVDDRAEAMCSNRRSRAASASPADSVLRLRGGFDEGKLSAWLKVLRRILFPGNPPRVRSAVAPKVEQKEAAGSGPGKAPKTKGKGGPVIGVHSKAEFEKQLSGARSKQLVVVDFFASWCGPCKQIAPAYEEMAREFAHAKFLKVDVDECKDVSQAHGVTAMPTFKLFRAGSEVGSMQGADSNALREKVAALAGKPDRFSKAGASRKL